MSLIEVPDGHLRLGRDLPRRENRVLSKRRCELLRFVYFRLNLGRLEALVLLFQFALSGINRRFPREIQNIDAVLTLSALAEDLQARPRPVSTQQFQPQSFEFVIIPWYRESLSNRHNA